MVVCKDIHRDFIEQEELKAQDKSLSDANVKGQIEEAKYAKEMGSQTGQWIISSIECQESRRPKYVNNKGVVNGVRGNKIVGDFVLTLIIGETNFMGVVGTETKMQSADGKVRIAFFDVLPKFLILIFNQNTVQERRILFPMQMARTTHSITFLTSVSELRYYSLEQSSAVCLGLGVKPLFSHSLLNKLVGDFSRTVSDLRSWKLQTGNGEQKCTVEQFQILSSLPAFPLSLLFPPFIFSL